MVVLVTDPVRALRPSLLALLARWVHGAAVGVEVLPSAAHPLQVVCASKTLVVHPDRTSILGLLQAAALLAHGREVRTLGEATPQVVRGWLPAARKVVQQRLPALARLPARVWHELAGGQVLPRIAWDDARTEPPQLSAPPTRGRAPAPGERPPLEMFLPDCSLDGADDAFAGLIAGIQRGEQPLDHLPDLPDVPFVAIALRLGSRFEARGGFAEVVDHERHLLEIATGYANCVRTTAEDLLLDPPPDGNALQGRELDHGRIVDARIARRLGRDFPVFGDRPEPEWAFDPERHVAVVYSDLCSAEATLEDMAPSLRVNGSIAYAYELLGIRTEWHACRDAMVRGHGGRRVLVHVDAVLKGADEPWQAIVWERLRRLDRLRLPAGLQPASFPPLHLHRTVQRLQRLQQDHAGETLRHPVVLSSPNLTRVFDDERFFRRCLAAMELSLEPLHAGGPVKPFYWLPKALGRLASKSGRLFSGLVHRPK
ncbi:MAG: hypothetical protein U1F60_08780 [Planctomycetota bacterium]